MLSKIAKSELEKIKVAKLDNYDENSHTYHIKKYSEPLYNIGYCYLLELDDSLISPTGNQALISNWNRGTYPKYKYLKAEVSKKLNKMIYVDSIGYDILNDIDISYMWSGWLPSDNIKTVKQL